MSKTGHIDAKRAPRLACFGSACSENDPVFLALCGQVFEAPRVIEGPA